MISAAEFLKWLSVFNVRYGSGFTGASAVDAATTTDIAGTYDNGTAGVGATYTISATGAISLDGVATVVGRPYLLKDLSNAVYNGIYTLTTAGDVGINAVFTRSVNYDTPGEINSTGVISVVGGTTQENSGWYETNVIANIGTDPLSYIKFGNYGTVTEVDTGTGLTGGPITGSGTISIEDNGVTNSLLAQMSAYTLKGNNTGASADASDLTVSQVNTMLGNTSLTWSVATTSTQAMSVNSGYFTNYSVSPLQYTLPASAAIGSKIQIVGFSVSGWQLNQNAGQQIFFGDISTTSGTTGYLSSSNAGDCVTLIAMSSTVWFVTDSIGTLNFN